MGNVYKQCEFVPCCDLCIMRLQLYDTDTQVVNEAVDVLDEACGDEVTWKLVLLKGRNREL